MSQFIYAEDKPSDCRNCRYGRKNGTLCSLGEGRCYFLIAAPPKPVSECEGCPYGRDRPCVGWCTKKLMAEVGI